MPELTTILIPPGTIVLRGQNTGSSVHWTPVTLLDSVVAKATRLIDGAWGYTIDGQAYVCTFNSGIILPRFD